MKRYMLMIALCFSSGISAETLTIGITGDNPPFSQTMDIHQHYYGFDIQLMDAICTRMKVTCQYEAMLFKYFSQKIDNQQIDLAIDSIIITERRKGEYLLSDAYLPSYIQFLTTAHSSIKTLSDMKNAEIGVGVRQKEQFDEMLDKLNEQNAKIIVFNHIPELLEGLAQGKVNVIVLNSVSAQYWYNNNADQYKLIDKPIILGEGFGIMAKKGNNALMDRVNATLSAMKADGSYAKIVKEYF